MASRKGGKVDVSFAGEQPFTVAAKGKELPFNTLTEFQVFAEENKLSPEAIASVKKAVVQHYVQIEETSPLSAALGANLQADKGVSVGPDRETPLYIVNLPYNPDIVKAMRAVPAARFGQEAKAWFVPYESRAALETALQMADQVLGQVASAKAAIDEEVKTLAKEGQLQGITQETALRVTGFHRPEWIYVGPIVAANAHYVAQLAEHDKDAATVVIHRAADLPEPVFKGDKVAVSYDSNGKAQLLTPEQAQTKFASLANERFQATLGKQVDGITVSEAAEGMVVKMDYSLKAATILYRLNKYGDDAVKFQREQGAYLVSREALDKDGALDDFKRTLHAARRELREEKSARNEIEQIAEQKLTGAKVQYPQGKDGEFQSGKIVAVTDRFVLQAAGRDFMRAHDASKLADVPEVGQTVTIRYAKGKATVVDRSQVQERSTGMSR
ncbi:hypothetical protein ACFFU8_09050 [Chromobacterium piscinae]|uniref:KfrB domain-containing protein n=1 Tax=Chromobacterium piscinae TaxID=686831 RepID=UPI001E64B3AB|nr:hypothetical protein [Chromobacterium piscinae]MCD5327949.1 hypothetical protein [Chromobacterium piscinae]